MTRKVVSEPCERDVGFAVENFDSILNSWSFFILVCAPHLNWEIGKYIFSILVIQSSNTKGIVNTGTKIPNRESEFIPSWRQKLLLRLSWWGKWIVLMRQIRLVINKTKICRDLNSDIRNHKKLFDLADSARFDFGHIKWQNSVCVMNYTAVFHTLNVTSSQWHVGLLALFHFQDGKWFFCCCCCFFSCSGFVGINRNMKYMAFIAVVWQPKLHWLTQIPTKRKKEFYMKMRNS